MPVVTDRDLATARAELLATLVDRANVYRAGAGEATDDMGGRTSGAAGPPALAGVPVRVMGNLQAAGPETDARNVGKVPVRLAWGSDVRDGDTLELVGAGTHGRPGARLLVVETPAPNTWAVGLTVICEARA